MHPSRLGSGSPGLPPRLRIVAVNDVYLLDNFPRLATLIAKARTEDPADALLVTLAGDFLSPSMLSSLDGGFGMVDLLNHVGVTHVCFGNHEDDLDRPVLEQRLAEFRGVWLSSNIFGFATPLPAHDIVTVTSPTGESVRVGLVGVCTLDPALYRTPPFDGAPTIAPAAALARETAVLRDTCHCNTIIPLTHLAIADDRAIAHATAPLYPVLLGGHDHQPFLENIDGTHIVKAGSDAFCAVVIDLVWEDGADAAPTFSAVLEELADFAEEPSTRARVDQHLEKVRALEAATLMMLPPGVTLSSVGTRSRQTSMGTLLCSRVRDGLRADACIINGGGIRGARDYQGQLTYGALKAEVPFDNEVIVVPMPGAVLEAAIIVSRSRAPVEAGAFLQVDDGIVVGEGNRLEMVAGDPFDATRLYHVATLREFFFGMDRIEPLIAFGAANPRLLPPVGTGREVKQALVESFVRGLWRALGGFDALDLNGDSVVTRCEVAVGLEAHVGMPPSPVTTGLVLTTFDVNKDGRIDRAEADSKGD